MTKRIILITLSVAVAAVVAAWFAGFFGFFQANDTVAYSRALDVIKAYDGRNAAVAYYFENVRKDPETAKKIKDQAAEARKLGESIRVDLALAEPFASTRKNFERYTEIQCSISKTVDDQNFRKTPAWTQVSQHTGRYNEAVQSNFTLYERTFGSTKLLFRDCS